MGALARSSDPNAHARNRIPLPTSRRCKAKIRRRYHPPPMLFVDTTGDEAVIRVGMERDTLTPILVNFVESTPSR
jgi:hypothetical protein